MKITLDQQTLAQAVTNHLRSVGVASDILQVEFRYTRVPYTVFAEVELAEAKTPTKRATAPVQEREVVPPVAPPSLVDPDNLPALAEEDQPSPDVPPSDTPSSPLFGGE
jgi:hypothetical protein